MFFTLKKEKSMPMRK